MATSSTTTTTVDLREPGDLLAATPQLLGFRPSDSVLVIGHRGPGGTRIGAVLRADLPSPGQERDLALRLLEPLLQNSVAVTIAVIGATSGAAGDPAGAGRDVPRQNHAAVLPEPRREESSGPGPLARAVVTALSDVCSQAGLRVPHALWTDEIRAGAHWACFDGACCSGRLPDPGSSVLAAVSTHAGLVTYSSREAMGRQLAPVEADTLARRCALLDERVRGEPAPDERTAVRHGRAAVRSALTRAWEGEPVLSDAEVVDLARALASPGVRDACLTTALPPGGPGATAAERLWLTLTRQTPAPERARPATLLAYSAYVRGDGALAGMALSTAREADPDHLLARLLTQALDHALPPDTLARLATTAEVEPLWTPPEEESRFPGGATEETSGDGSVSSVSPPDGPG